MLFNFKDFLTLDEVGEYLVANGYPEFNRDRLITFVKDLINENKLSIAVYYKGNVCNELSYRDKDQSRVYNPDDSCYINTYSWLDFNTAYALFSSESTISNGISSKDVRQERFNLTPNIKNYKSLIDHKNEAYNCWTFIENEDYKLTLDDVRYYRPDLDILFNKKADTHAQIDLLNEKLKQANAALAAFKKNTPISNKLLYTTPAIDIMKEVIKEFWINYNPNQPAPKQSTITKWITDNFDGVSDALALNIDKVCRHSDARSGGKYKR